MTLLPSQERMIPFALRHREALLACGMGVGKTRATLEVIRQLIDGLEIGAAVIVAPLRVSLLTWPAEAARWTPELKVVSLRTEAGQQAWRDGTADIYLINYEMLPQFTEKCLKGKRRIPAHLIVWDEIHKLKDPSGMRVKRFFPYRKLFHRHLGLSGTIAPNSILEVFNQVKVLDGGERLGTGYSAFRDRYTTADFMGFKFTVNEGAADKIMERISDMTLVIKGADWDVTVEDIDLSLPPEVMNQYKKLEKKFLLKVERREIVALSAGVLVSKLRQFTSGAAYVTEEDESRGVLPLHDVKINALKKLHDSIKREPMLVLVQYRHELDRILKAFPYAREFDVRGMAEWDAGAIPMWVSHPDSISTGLNLQKSCCKVCWMSGTYRGDTYPQVNARVARPGQTRPVRIYRMIVRGTIDEAIIESLRTKGRNQDSALEILMNLRILAENR